ncbi:lactonase family protein [Seonamhaeicola sp.]|uniref:lactonase family protein n=1 Tax=Seonamhaeicola sp. TaxID=1912245 RepID=UPI002633C1C6|nr:lactonase family protein [Seonamhaeicola sp.]
MKIKLLFSGFIFSILNFSCTAQTVPLYIGTYTQGDSEGIYKLDFNTKTGALSNLTLALKIDNPSFLSYTPDKKTIYAVGEGAVSAVSALKVNQDGSLKLLNTVSSNGKGPCHVSVNESGNKAVVSNYGGGNVSVYNLNNDGSLNDAQQVFDHNTETEKARAHSAQFYKDDLFVSDLGRNAIYQYKLEDATYSLKSEAIVKMKGNPGPRHFALTKDGQFIYIINEYGGSVTSVKRIGNGFQTIDEDSTLDENYTGNNSCADIHLSKDEHFLYGSNRGENSIAVFKRNTKTGTLDKIQNISVHGNWPRNFTLDPTGKFLLVANQKSHNISVFKINVESGKLSYLHAIEVPSPVCLLF